MAQNSSLTKELGHGGLTITPWNSLYDEKEEITELAWPNCIPVYDRMMNDEQIAALFLALLLPIYRYEWYVDPNGAKDEHVAHIADDLGLPILGTKPDNSRRRKGKFNFAEHLKVALPLPLRFGNAWFEQLYSVGDNDLLHVKKLAARMPRTIAEIVADEQGSLLGIVQHAPGQIYNQHFQTQRQALNRGTNLSGIPIPVNRLVAYVHEKEGGDWFGNSMLRAVFRNFTIKDRLLRVDAIKHERNGMGIPTAVAPQGATKTQIAALQAAVDQIKAAESGGVVIPYGSEISLEGVQGTLPDTLASIKEHNEAMARRFLAMFLNLGTTQSGARALGDTFVDSFALIQQSIAEEFTDTFNAYVIEDLVDLNWGEDAQMPKLAFKAEAKKELAVADFKTLIDSGALVADDGIKQYVRDAYELPEAEPEPEREKLAPVVPIKKGTAVVEDDDNVVEEDKEVAASQLELAEEIPGRKLRRDKTPQEIQSQTDFDALEATYNGSVTALITLWKAQVSAPQVAALAEQIEQANGDLVKLTQIAAPVLGANILKAEMERVAAISIAQATGEAAAQGTVIIPPSPETLAVDITQRSKALAVVMAKSITEAASRNAVNQGGLDPKELAQSITDHLKGLSDQFLVDNLGGAVQTAQNDARFAVFAQGDDEVDSYYASELLDRVTCPPCKRIDGTQYKTIEDARSDYVSGWYKLCEGGPRCRGTIIALMKSESKPSVVDVPDKPFEGEL